MAYDSEAPLRGDRIAPQVSGVVVDAGGGLQAEAVAGDGGPGACAAQQLVPYRACPPGGLQMRAGDRMHQWQGSSP